MTAPDPQPNTLPVSQSANQASRLVMGFARHWLLFFNVAWLVYVKKSIRSPEEQASAWFLFLRDKWRFDELYENVFVKPLRGLAQFLWQVVDVRIIDGAVNGVGLGIGAASQRLRRVQTGLVTSRANFPRPPVDLHTVIDGPSGGTTGPTGVLGEEVLHERIGDLEIDPGTRQVRLSGEPIELSRKEFDLLWLLASRGGEVVTKREMLAEVWGLPFGGGDRTVDVHLSWLRRKLGETAAQPRYLYTVRGVGVRLAELPES